MLKVKEGNLIIWLECERDGNSYDDPCYVVSGYSEDSTGFQRDLNDDELDELSQTFESEIFEYMQEKSIGDSDWVYDMIREG